MTDRERKGLAIALFTGIAAFIYVFDSDWLRPPLERLITEQTGRPFSAEHLSLDFGVPLRAHLRGVRFGNPDWAREREMLAVERADFTLELMPLLRDRAVVLPYVHLSKPVVDLESTDDGRGNWELSRRAVDPDAPPGPAPAIGRLRIDEGVLRVRLPPQKVDLRVNVATADDGKLKIVAQGNYRAMPLEADGTTAGILSILDQAPFPLDLQFQVGSTHGSVTGALHGAVTPGSDLKLDIAGDSLADLFDVLGIVLPSTPPYHLNARVIRQDGAWIVNGIDGHVGDSDLSGKLRLLFRHGRPRLEASLTSERLDLDDLGVAVGAPPKTGADQTASPEQAREAVAQKHSGKVVPDKPFDFARLRTMDADVDYTARSFRGAGHVLDDLRAHLLLRNGVLRFRPLDFGIGGGNVAGTLDVDARGDHMKLVTDLDFRQLDLRKMFPNDTRLSKSPAGVIGGRATLHSTGDTPAELFANANGRLGLASSGGEVSTLMLAFSQMDALKIAPRMLMGDGTTELRCAVADVDVNKGVVRTRAVVIDSKDANIHVDGEVNLQEEKLDLTVNPLPKKVSLLTLRSPIHIKGTFKDPAIRPDYKLFLRIGAAAALGAVLSPFAAVVPLIENGPGKDADCPALKASVERDVGKKIPEATGAEP